MSCTNEQWIMVALFVACMSVVLNVLMFIENRRTWRETTKMVREAYGLPK